MRVSSIFAQLCPVVVGRLPNIDHCVGCVSQWIPILQGRLLSMWKGCSCNVGGCSIAQGCGCIESRSEFGGRGPRKVFGNVRCGEVVVSLEG